MKDIVQELTPEVEHRGRRRYTDISNETPWDDEDAETAQARRREITVTSTGLPTSMSAAFLPSLASTGDMWRINQLIKMKFKS
eukprot:4674434-Amphidinium_carterae.2